METLGSVSITALLYRLIMLCAVMFETTWHTRSGLHLQARAPPLTAKTAQKQLKEHKKHNQGYWPDLSTTPRSQSDQACTELFRTHLIFWGSKQQPPETKRSISNRPVKWMRDTTGHPEICLCPSAEGSELFCGEEEDLHYLSQVLSKSWPIVYTCMLHMLSVCLKDTKGGGWTHLSRTHSVCFTLYPSQQLSGWF